MIAADGYVLGHYEYAPFGAIGEKCGECAAQNPWRFSSEVFDEPIGVVYYNYRHYGVADGRWFTSDRNELAALNGVAFLENSPLTYFDHRGLDKSRVSGGAAVHDQFVHEKPDNGMFDSLVSHADSWTQVWSGNDILEHFKSLSLGNQCIEKYTIAGHGRGGETKDSGRKYIYGIPGAYDFDGSNGNRGIYLDESAKPRKDLNVDKGGIYLEALQEAVSNGEICFCDNCRIQIYACRIAPLFAVKLHLITGCTVTAASGSCNKVGEKWQSAPGNYLERMRKEYFGFYSIVETPKGTDLKLIGELYDPF